MKPQKLVIGFLTDVKVMADYAKRQLGNNFKNVPVAYKYLDKITGKSCGNYDSKDVNIILADPDISLDIFKTLPSSVKLVQFTWAGIDGLTKRMEPTDTFKPSFAITRLGRGYAKGMADYVVGEIISLERQFKLAFENQSRHEWIGKFTGSLHQLVHVCIY